MQPDDAGFDPVALTLALWLGLLTCIGGVVRLSENAARADALARQQAPASAIGIGIADPAGFGIPTLVASGQASTLMP